MPVSESRLYNSLRLNRWFAVSSILMTMSLGWLIYVDYARPWRAYQGRFALGKAALAHLDFLDASREERRREISLVRQRWENARHLRKEAAGARRQQLLVDIAEADLAFRKAEGPWSRVDQVLEVTRDTYERTLGRYGADDPLTRSAHEKVLAEEELVENLRKVKEEHEDRKKLLEGELKTIDEPVRIAAKRLSSLEDVAEAALKKDQQYRGVLEDDGLLAGLPIVRAIINMPLLDFAAPRNTPGREQVNQLVLPHVRSRLNYLESYTTDRCTTCHVAINDPEFSKDRLARKLERSIPAINEALRRQGLDETALPDRPTIEGAEQPLAAGEVTEHWDELTEAQQGSYFNDLLTVVNNYLTRTGRKTIDLRQPILAHPDLDLYLSVDSPHPMAKMGCTVCHEGNGQETDFVLAAHSPPTHQVRKAWEEKYYRSVLGIPNITFETVEHYWDRPMRLHEHSEAGCAKCHSEITDISEFGGERKGMRINLGRFLFTSVGCINCHNVDDLAGARRVAPDMTHIASKLKPEFIQQWVYFPQKFRPSTRMPHFFLQENNNAASANQFDPDPVLRTKTEVSAATQYLLTVSRPWEAIEKPEGVEGDSERGRKLFRKVGCLACHANLAEFGDDWITRDLVQRTNLDEETARHRYGGMTNEQRVRYAMAHFINERDTFLHPDKARFDLDEPTSVGVFTRFAPELSGIGSKVTFDWLYSWLIDPTHYAPDTKMPRLQLSPSEAADLAAYLMTLKNEQFVQGIFEVNAASRRMMDDMIFLLLSSQRSEHRSRAIMEDQGGALTDMLVSLLKSSLGRQEAYDLIRPMTLEEKKITFFGYKSIAHYGCYACHEIPGFEGMTPPGTELTIWGEKPVSQLDFAFYDHAFHNMRHEHEETYAYIYPRDAAELNYWSPIEDRAREQISHTHDAFAQHKLLNPRIWDREKIKRPYDKLKMPNFYFTNEESEALTTYLLSRVKPRVDDVLKVDYQGDHDGPIARGRTLTRELNCVACHQIEDNAPTVQQYYRRKLGDRMTFDSINAPPSLWGEGAKLQHPWFHRFLQQVEPLRPWLQVRMPSFNLTGDQATTLVEYFAALSQRDAEVLSDMVAPVDEYIEGTKTESAKSSQADTNAGLDWFEQESLETEIYGLKHFATARKLVRKADLDPQVTGPDRVRTSYGKLLKRVHFLRDVYDVAYPFVEPPMPLSPEPRFEMGSRFFDDMGCLKCHVLGRMLPGPARNTTEFVQVYRLDGVQGEGAEAVALINGERYPIGSVLDGHTLLSAENTYYDTGDVETKAVFEGPAPSGETERVVLLAASAPNLSLTHQRLRRTWVYNWMLDPQLIQPGTKMPQNFPDGQSPFEGDPAYPGDGKDHIDLLVDYLYDAGTRGVRADLPKIVVVDEDDEFDDEEGFDEEDFDD